MHHVASHLPHHFSIYCIQPEDNFFLLCVFWIFLLAPHAILGSLCEGLFLTLNMYATTLSMAMKRERELRDKEQETIFARKQLQPKIHPTITRLQKSLFKYQLTQGNCPFYYFQNQPEPIVSISSLKAIRQGKLYLTLKQGVYAFESKYVLV